MMMLVGSAVLFACMFAGTIGMFYVAEKFQPHHKQESKVRH